MLRLPGQVGMIRGYSLREYAYLYNWWLQAIVQALRLLWLKVLTCITCESSVIAGLSLLKFRGWIGYGWLLA